MNRRDVLIDDWRMTQAGTLGEGFDDMHEQAHQGRLGNYARAIVAPNVPTRRGDRIRLRQINVTTDRIFPLELAGIADKVVALDGMPLADPQNTSDLILAPAQRVDIIADVTATDQIAFIPPTRDCPFHLGKVPVAAEKSERQMSDMKTRVTIT